MRTSSGIGGGLPYAHSMRRTKPRVRCGSRTATTIAVGPLIQRNAPEATDARNCIIFSIRRVS